MNLEIDAESHVAPYEQLRLAIIEQVRSGVLVAGTKLPTVRKLAADIRLAPNTVARAYRELEQAEVLETRGRLGTFVAATGDPTRDQAGRAATEYIAAIRRLGLTDRDAVELLDTALRAGG